MSNDVLQGKWNELQGEIKEQWGRLTDDDLLRVKGKRDRLEGALQEKYGYSKQKAREEIDSFLSEFEGQVEDMRARLRDTVHETQEKLAERTHQAGKVMKEKADQYNQRLEEAVAHVPGNPAEIVSKYPWLVIVTVLVMGIVVGLLLRPTGNR